jgi:hypothetical protein
VLSPERSSNLPMTAGHLGEWIAAQGFDIELERSPSIAAIDGLFCTGLGQGQTVASWLTPG